MKSLCFAAICLASSSAAMAQLSEGPSLSGTFGGVLTANGYIHGTDNGNFPPDIQRTGSAREKVRLRQALALRHEAFALQAADGGVLSTEHKRYINRRAIAIMDE